MLDSWNKLQYWETGNSQTSSIVSTTLELLFTIMGSLCIVKSNYNVGIPNYNVVDLQKLFVGFFIRIMGIYNYNVGIEIS